jgi:hypothetical protein
MEWNAPSAPLGPVVTTETSVPLPDKPNTLTAIRGTASLEGSGSLGYPPAGPLRAVG